MRFAKLVSTGAASLILALSMIASGAQAHDDDYGWKRKHHHHHHRSPVYVVRERPVYYYSQPRVYYAPPPVAYYPGPPSLNINIPLR
jgi:hypothetical protein